MRTSLLIGIHPDDEILSFGGFIINELEKGNQVHIYIMAIGGPSSKASPEERLNEFYSAMDFLGVPKSNIGYYKLGVDGRLDNENSSDITAWIDELIERIRPAIIMTNYMSVHQDHIAGYKAFQAAMRLKSGYNVPTVAYGEYSFILQSLDLPSGGKIYCSLTEKQLQKKCDAFEIYKSQLKPSPSPLGVHGIRKLAEVRGLESFNEYAELYYLQRGII